MSTATTTGKKAKAKQHAKKSSASFPREKLVRVRAEDIKDLKPPTKQQIERFKRMKDSDIDFSDIPELTKEELARMVTRREFRKRQPVSVRIDPRVIEWLKSKGPGHLTLINDILLNLMEAEQQREWVTHPPRTGAERPARVTPPSPRNAG